MATLLNNSRLSAHPQLAPRRGTQRPSKKAQFTPEPVANGFLRYCFEPVVDDVKELDDQPILEAEFFNSLSFFAQAYALAFNVRAMENTSVYPHNVFLAFSQAEAALQTLDPNASLAIIEDEEGHRSTLAVYKVYETGYSSYFLPLQPVYQLLREKYRLAATALLCSLISYLHDVAGVSFFSDQSSYVFYQCDLMSENMGEDEDEAHLAEFESLLTHTRTKGAALQRYIRWKGNHLAEFDKRHQTFQPADEWEEGLHRISTLFVGLYRDNPTRTYYQSYEPGLTHPDDDYWIDPDQRISFLWDWDDWVHDNLLDSLDCEFNGGGYVEEPLAYRLFDQPTPKPTLSLAFEEVFYTGLYELAELLKSLAHEQRNCKLREVVPADAGTAGLPTGE